MIDFTKLVKAVGLDHGRLALSVRSSSHETAVTVGDTIAVGEGAAPNAAFTLIAWSETWADFAKPIPAVGYQSIVGMVRMGYLRVEGDMLAFGRQPALPRAALRRAASRGACRAAAAVGAPVIEPVVGRYLRLDLNGRPHRIYFEEAGQGIPLVCLHTAGADGRQYRALLNDAEITARFRVIVFDLPWHGKSSPPPGFEREAYQLTTDLYVDTVMAVCRALGLEKPVVMGCSIGGRAVLHLALRHGDYFRAAIGLQSATHADAGADTRLRDLGVHASARRARPGSRGRLRRLPDLSDLAQSREVGDALALHARRPGRLPRRPALLFRRRRPAERPARRPRHRDAALCTC